MTGREPFIASAVLTLGTMAISTTVVGDGAMAATRALIAMPAQHGGATMCDRPQHFAVEGANPMLVVLDEAIALSANDIGHLQRWPAHFFSSLRERRTRSAVEISSASSGLVTACRCLRDRCR